MSLDTLHVCCKIKEKTDILVIGRGPAGVCAAIAAARNGMDVIMIEQLGFSGGMATAGLLGAGCCISADSEAAGAVRVMPPCMAMGQAAGTAAATAVKNGCRPDEIDSAMLRETLRTDGAYL